MNKTMRYIKNIQRIGLLLMLPLAFASCTDVWNGHYDVDNQKQVADKSLWEEIASRPELQGFAECLKQHGYDVMLDSYETLVIGGTTEEPTLSVGYYDGKILLENIPEGMVVMVVGYTDGQMTELQMVEVVAGDIEVSEDVLDCGASKAFFMNGGFAPIHRGLLID